MSNLKTADGTVKAGPLPEKIRRWLRFFCILRLFPDKRKRQTLCFCINLDIIKKAKEGEENEGERGDPIRYPVRAYRAAA